MRAVLPGMLERGSGYLLHTASMAGILTSHGNLTYAVTKHAVVGLAEWLSITYHDKGIRVSLLAPLGVRTPMLGDPTRPSREDAAGPIKEPDEVADMVVDAIADERFLILTDPIAQKWMNNKTADLERWLNGMRRLQRDDQRGRCVALTSPIASFVRRGRAARVPSALRPARRPSTTSYACLAIRAENPRRRRQAARARSIRGCRRR